MTPGQDPPVPQGFTPVDQQAAQDPPPPPGFTPVDQATTTTQQTPPAPDDGFDTFRKDHPYLSVATDALQGVGSGVFSTLHGIDKLGTKAWSAISGEPEQPNIVPEGLTKAPSSVAGNVGHAAEQIAEFFLPATKLGQANKAIEATQLAPWLQTVAKAGVEAVPAYGITMAQTGGDTTAARNAALTAFGVTAALPAIGWTLKNWTGATSGAGDVAVGRAAEKPTPELISAMKGEIDEKTILEATRQAIANVAQKRSVDYTTELAKIDPRIQVNLTPARRAMNDLMNQFRVRRILNPNTQKVELNFDGSHLWSDSGAQDQIRALWDKMMSPMAQDPRSVDALKRGVDAMYRESGQSRAVVQGVRDTLRDSLNQAVPNYQKMTSEYAKASDFLDDLADLSTHVNNDGTAIRKLAGSLKQNNNYRETLLDSLSQYTNKDLVGMIAGNRLSKGGPRGIVSALHAAGSIVTPTAFLHMAAYDPTALAGSLMSLFALSPRAVGEAAIRAKLISRFGKAASTAAAGQLSVTGQQPDYDANAFGKAKGGPVHYDDGGDVSDDDASQEPVLRDIEKRRMIQLGQNPGQFWQQPVTIDPEQAQQRVFGTDYQAPPRPAMGPPQDPGQAQAAQEAQGRQDQTLNSILNRDNGSYAQTMAQINPTPEWIQRANTAVNQPFSMPTTGGSPMNLSDLIQVPQSKADLGLLAAGVLLPGAGGKLLKKAGKGVLKAGTAALEGAAPEVGSLSQALEAAPRSDITAAEILRNAAAGPGKFGSYSKYMERNPTAGEGLFDSSNPQPTFPDRPAIARYDPSAGRGRGPSARIVDAFNNPKVINGLKKYVRQGGQQLPEDWYANDPVLQVYQQEWGPQAEEKFYQQMGHQAATSTGSAVPDNIRTGSLYNYMHEQNIPFPAKPPKGYGSKYQVAHRDTALNFRDTGTVDPIANPKRASFTENLMGNEDLLTGDKHFMRLVGILSEDPRFLKTTAEVSRGGQNVKIKPQDMFNRGELTMADAVKDPNLWVEAPNPNEYLHMEQQFRNKVAKPLKYTVADAQGKAWVGGGELTGLGSPPETWIELLKHRVQYTADRLNVDPQVILRKFVRGEIPLLELGAGAAGLGAWSQMQQGQNPASGTDQPGTVARP